MKVLHSQSGDSVGVRLDRVSFRSLIRALRALPGVRIEEAVQHINDGAFAVFEYKAMRFEIHTPLSDYWIDRPANCPAAVFQEIVQHLERFPLRWWHRII